MNAVGFTEWAASQVGMTTDEVEAIKLAPAFDIFTNRAEGAAENGAADPLMTITSKRAGGNSRRVTQRMLGHLHYTPTQRRAMHRLMGQTGRWWPGLLRLYVQGVDLDARHRQYARRQFLLIRDNPPEAPVYARHPVRS